MTRYKWRFFSFREIAPFAGFHPYFRRAVLESSEKVLRSSRRAVPVTIILFPKGLIKNNWVRHANASRAFYAPFTFFYPLNEKYITQM